MARPDRIQAEVDQMTIEQILQEVKPEDAKNAMRQTLTELKNELATRATVYARDKENPALEDWDDAQRDRYFSELEKRMRTLMWGVKHIEAKLKASDDALWQLPKDLKNGAQPALIKDLA